MTYLIVFNYLLKASQPAETELHTQTVDIVPNAHIKLLAVMSNILLFLYLTFFARVQVEEFQF